MAYRLDTFFIGCVFWWSGMFDFGRELRRIFKGNSLENDHQELDTSLIELMNLQLLITHGRALDIEAGRISTKNRYDPYISSAQIWREYARRTGDPMAMSKAAMAAENAGKEAKTLTQARRAALEQALTCITGRDLFNTDDLMVSAQSLLDEGQGVVHGDGRVSHLHLQAQARIASRLALKEGVCDLEPIMNAMASIDRSIASLDQQVIQTKTAMDKIKASQMRLERADILLLVGLDRDDCSVIKAVITDLQAVAVRLDPAYEPVTHAQTLLRLGIAHTYLGRIKGDIEIIKNAIDILNPDEDMILYDHSPLDWTDHKCALALAYHALADHSLEQGDYDKAIEAFDLALKRPLQKGLSLRNQLIVNRATCLAQQAEFKGDLTSLNRAESEFKSQLRLIKPQEDPIAWAVLQTNLARLYIVRGDLMGYMVEGSEAVYALELAIEIFQDHSQNALVTSANTLLSRVKSLPF